MPDHQRDRHATRGRAQHEVLDPADGSVLGAVVDTAPDDVARVVASARDAAHGWDGAPLAHQARALRAWRGRLWRDGAHLADLLQRESGLPLDEAMREVLSTVEHLRWAETHLARVLGQRSVATGAFTPDLSARAGYTADGVVGVAVLGRPSLYAVASALTTALAAGNTVVLAPGRRLALTLDALVEAFEPGRTATSRVQVTHGDDDVVDALAGAALDRLCVLGPPVAAVRLTTAAARAMVPVVVVPVVPPITVVAPDADLDAAALAVLAAGEGAEGTEHDVYVAPDVVAGFEAALAEARTSSRRDDGRGALARALGRRRGVTPALPGPARAAVRLHTAPAFDVLLDRLREHPGAQVAVHSRRHGARLAELLGAADVRVNVPDVAVPADGALPRAALGARGYGVLGGDDGLRTFARARTVTQRRRSPLALPTAPADALLATPAGRLAARVALHVRHTLG